MSIVAVHVHKNHVQVVTHNGYFVNVGYDSVVTSAGSVDTANHDSVSCELTRSPCESSDDFGRRVWGALGISNVADLVDTAEQIVGTQPWIHNKRRARFGIG